MIAPPPSNAQALIDGRYRTRLLTHQDVLVEPAVTAAPWHCLPAGPCFSFADSLWRSCTVKES
jgi:hypothetical protein